jgi:hypothetical protein
MPKSETPAQETNNAALQESEGWRPNDGDVLTGKVHGVSKAWSDWSNSFYPLVTVQTDDGKLVDVHAFHQTLQSRLMELKPEIGTPIEFAFLGKRPTKDGKREVAVYKVTVPGETGANTWAELSGQDARAAAAAAVGDVPADTEGLPAANQPTLDDGADIPF